MTRLNLTRRSTLGLIAAGSASLAMPHYARASNGAHVVVVGGGFGGATAARYLRRRMPDLAVTLIEPAETFYTCPFSNLYLGGLRSFESIGHGFDDLRAHGVEVIHAYADAVDSDARKVTLSDGTVLDYDKLVLSPGVDMQWGALDGYDEAASERAPHAWKAGAQTQLLKSQLDAMEDGGLFVMSIPDNPFRCPPGPYERASMIAHYFKENKPASKLLLLDSKDSFSKQGLFQAGWDALYGDMIEWVPMSEDGRVIRVDAEALEVETAFGEIHKAAVLNVIPPQKAGAIADKAGVVDNTGWVPVNGQTFESQLVEHIHVVGDATIAAPMPKSGFCASGQGKVAAAAIVAMLRDEAPPPSHFANTCYSLIGPDYGISVAGVYHAPDGVIAEMPDSGGVSPADAPASFRRQEARYGAGWYASISQDIWGSSA
ncbi:MAG: NAD(P)/FAD-dependent oxidoreductase [Paracoccus sp. (in: a-proteobacteria)]|nr:NAD(P)/FAD-dependent oxidoreductase [Paracoccus sp. (in: a-proteobacteria)]